MTDFDKDLIESFYRNFSFLKGKPIVLYGKGDKTKIILENCPEFEFVGIMDRQSGGTCFGMPVLNEQEAIQKAYCIIIVCNFSNVDVIYQRICDWTAENNIAVYHCSGREMKIKNRCEKASSLYCDIEKYKEAIRANDIISFDLFDTLIMRYTLYPADIFELMQKRLEAEENEFSSFSKLRKESELKLAKMVEEYGYTLNDIYAEYIKTAGLDESYVSYLEEMELQLELDNILPRKAAAELLYYAQKLNKKIIAVSDMYLTRAQISRLLSKCGIPPEIFSEIYISSERNASKSSGKLWKQIREIYGDSKILHFGDNPEGDGIRAEENGINHLPVYSSMKLALNVLDSKWLKYENDPECRYLEGIFIACAFNSPFCVDKTGRVIINSLYEMGFEFVGLAAKYFLDVLYTSAKEKNQKIVFQARDCYILKLIADAFYSNYGVESTYLLTSRRAIALVNIYDYSDIEKTYDIFAISCQHTFSRFCQVIYNIKTNSDDEYNNRLIKDIPRDEALSHIKLHYTDAILNESAMQRKNFSEYISQLKLDKDDKLAIINYVGGGITQSLFEQYGFVKNCEYYYFAMMPLYIDIQLLSPVKSVFGTGSAFTCRNNPIIEKYVLGECIFTSPQSQFMGFSPDGEKLFAGSGRNETYEDIKACHEGIINYFKITSGLIPDISRVPSDFINFMYGCLFDDDAFIVPKEIRKKFILDNEIKSDEVIKVWND